MEAVVVNKANGGSTALGNKPCHVKVSSSTSIVSDSDDERITSSPPASPDQSQSKTMLRSPHLPTCCGHNNKEASNGNINDETAQPKTTFINGFTECLRLVRSLNARSTMSRQKPHQLNQISSNLEETLESYLSDLQQQIHSPASPKSYYDNQNNIGVISGKCVEYSPQHSPAGSTSSSVDDLHMTLAMEEGAPMLMKPHKYQHHHANFCVEMPTTSSASSSPVLISSSSNSPKMPYPQQQTTGRMMKGTSTVSATQNKYFIPTRLPNGEVAFVLKSESKNTGGSLLASGNNDKYFGDNDTAYDHYAEYNYTHQQQHQHYAHHFQSNQQQHLQQFHQQQNSQPMFHSPGGSETHSPFHSRFFDIDSPRVLWRPWWDEQTKKTKC